jgi:hypothetical protein
MSIHEMYDEIYIYFDYTPKVGISYFNNNGEYPADSGTTGYCYSWRINTAYNRISTNGYVEVTSITKDDMAGIFEFFAKGDINDRTGINITEGKFYVPIYRNSVKVWEGPK